MTMSPLIPKEPMCYASDEEVDDLVRQFERCTLPYAAWTHEAHLTVGLWYLVHHDTASATPLVREGIIRYNAACGVDNTDTSGYHETITCFYLQIIRHYLGEREPGTPLHALANELIQGRYADRTFLLSFYSRARLFSVAARRHWMEPDLKPLPDVG